MICLFIDPKNFVLTEVWEMIDQHMEVSNKELLRQNLNLEDQYIFGDSQSFKKIRVPWEQLRVELQSLDEDDMVNEIQSKTFITSG